MFVDALYLRETMRGASIGKELMAKVASEARLLGCTSVRVMTPAENSGGAAFYRKLGGVSIDKIWFSIPIPMAE
jgi:GNAT superfamily N-acetyltransferase